MSEPWELFWQCKAKPPFFKGATCNWINNPRARPKTRRSGLDYCERCLTQRIVSDPLARRKHEAALKKRR